MLDVTAPQHHPAPQVFLRFSQPAHVELHHVDATELQLHLETREEKYAATLHCSD